MMMMSTCLVRRLKRKRRLLKNVQPLSRHLERRKNVKSFFFTCHRLHSSFLFSLIMNSTLSDQLCLHLW